MSEVVVRQWSDRVFAGYAEIGGRWMLVGTEESRQAAYDFTLNVVNDPLEVRNRCYNSLFTARRRVVERVSVGQLGVRPPGARKRSDRRTTRTPAANRSLL